jgi:CheY-like chemotaxis protein
MDKKSIGSIWNPPRQSFKQMRQETKPALPECVLTKRLLLADDDEVSIDLFFRATRGWNYDLIAAMTAHETQDILGRMEPLAGAVLDNMFLNGSGIQIYMWIANNRPDLKVAFLTGYTGQKMQDLVKDVGPAIVLNKDMLNDEAAIAKLMLLFGIERR